MEYDHKTKAYPAGAVTPPRNIEAIYQRDIDRITVQADMEQVRRNMRLRALQRARRRQLQYFADVALVVLGLIAFVVIFTNPAA